MVDYVSAVLDVGSLSTSIDSAASVSALLVVGTLDFDDLLCDNSPQLPSCTAHS